MSNGSKTYWVSTPNGLIEVHADQVVVAQADGDLKFFRGSKQTGYELVRALARGEWSDMSEGFKPQKSN